MNYISEPKMKGSGVSQKHTAVGQRSEQIAFKAVCFTDGSERRGLGKQGKEGRRDPSGKLDLMLSYFTIWL